MSSLHLLECAACGNLPRDAVNVYCCSRLMCWECCINRQICTCGREIIAEKCKPADGVIQRLLNLAPRKCKHVECDVTLPKGELAAHESACPEAYHVCPRSTECGLFKRADLGDHIDYRCVFRTATCPQLGCDMQMAEQDIERHLSESCRYVQIRCPNECGEAFPRSLLEEHLSVMCALAPVTCPYEKFGCKSVVMRQEYEDHMSLFSVQHSLLLVQQVTELKEKHEQPRPQPVAKKASRGRNRERKALPNVLVSFSNGPVVQGLRAWLVSCSNHQLAWMLIAYFVLLFTPCLIQLMVVAVFAKRIWNKHIRKRVHSCAPSNEYGFLRRRRLQEFTASYIFMVVVLWYCLF